MVRHFKALLLVATLVIVACAVNTIPRVVTVIEPHVSILPLDVAKNPGLDGRVLCDLQGYPVIYVRMGIGEKATRAVVLHEKIHTEQAFAHRGGCFGLREQMSKDTMFRLSMEAAAFCSVIVTQRALGETPDPDYQEIFRLLSTVYGADYEPEAVRAAMVLCGP